MRDVSIVATVKRSSAVLVSVLVALSSLAVIAPVAHAANEGISTVTDKTVLIGESVAITDLQITGDDNDNVMLGIRAHNGTLHFETIDANVTGDYSSYVTVNGLLNDVNSTLASLMYTSNGPGADTIEVNLGSNVDNVIIDPIGGHAYTIVDDYLTWDDAFIAAGQLEYGGVQGYLANITSEEEDAFIVEHLTGNGWIGASDAGEEQEGNWKWVAGPEAGTQFWSGGNVFQGGHPVNDEYNNWNLSEPNNSGDEDCAEYIVGQGWNDLMCNSEYRSYVVEFGAADVPDPIISEFTITSVAKTTNVATCEQLFALNESNRYDLINLTDDIDCNGQTVEPLFQDDSFRGELNGNGHTIKNFVIDKADEAYVGLIAETRSATIRNLNLNTVQINGGADVGTVIGYAYESLSLENVHVKDSSVNAVGEWGTYYIGGLVGEAYVQDSSFTNLSFEGIINAQSGWNVGGLFGVISAQGEVIIEQVYADATITISGEGNDIGGLIGEFEAGGYDTDTLATLRNAYSWSTITITNPEDAEYDNVGGLIGRLDSEEEGYEASILLQNVYSKGSVQGNYDVGGLIGSIDSADVNAYTIENSFTMSPVEMFGEDESVGAIVGEPSTGQDNPDYLVLTDVYFDQTRTGYENCVGDDIAVGGCTAVNTDGGQPNYFVNNTINVPMNTWNFNSIWVMNQHVPPTFALILDTDNDSIVDSIEDAAPNGGDANNDGIADSTQAYVASLVDPLTGGYAALAVSQECAITSVSIAAESANHTQDDTYDYPAGFMNFTLNCGIDGFTAHVTQYYYGVSGDFVVKKYNPNTQTYSTIQNASVADQTIASQQVKVASYQVTDGGELDIDGEENGFIVDPVGLATAANANSNNGDLANTGQSTMLYMLIAGLLIAAGLSLAITRRVQRQN